MTQHPIAVFGASGAQGGAVATALIRSGRSVRAISRRPDAVAPLVDNGAEHAPADLAEPATVARALEGVAGAFVVLPFDAPPPIREQHIATVLDALDRSGCPPVVFTTSGPIPTEEVGAASLDSRLTIQRAVDASGLPIVTLVPGGYLGNLLGRWVAPAIVHDGRIPYPLPAELRRPWISVEDQAALAVAALDRPDLAGRSFTVGHHVSGTDIAAAVSPAIGREVQWTEFDLEQFAASLVPVVGEHAAADLAREYRLTAQHPGLAADALDYEAAPRELGVPLTPVKTWASAQDWSGAAQGPVGP